MGLDVRNPCASLGLSGIASGVDWLDPQFSGARGQASLRAPVASPDRVERNGATLSPDLLKLFERLVEEGASPELLEDVRALRQQLHQQEASGPGRSAPAGAGSENVQDPFVEDPAEVLQLLIEYLLNNAHASNGGRGGGRNLGALSSSGGGGGARPTSWGDGGGSANLGAGGPGSTSPGYRPQARGANASAPEAQGSGTAGEFIRQALSQQGGRYVFGGKGSPSDPRPNGLDCSGLVTWAAARAGIQLPNGSDNQRAATQRISVEQALRTPGALLFAPGHVAISLGDGRTIEAMDENNGIRIGQNATSRNWDSGGVIPGMA